MLRPADVKNWEVDVQCADGVYRMARPLPGFLKQRVLDAWEVFRGRALAVKTYDGSETGD